MVNQEATRKNALFLWTLDRTENGEDCCAHSSPWNLAQQKTGLLLFEGYLRPCALNLWAQTLTQDKKENPLF